MPAMGMLGSVGVVCRRTIAASLSGDDSARLRPMAPVLAPLGKSRLHMLAVLSY